MICRHCGYCLRGLESSVCPECGRAFDLHDPNSFAFGTVNGWVSFSVAVAWVVFNAAIWIYVGAYANVLVRVGGWRLPSIVGAGHAALVLMPVPLVAWLLWQLRQRRWRLTHRKSTFVGLLLVSVAWLYNLWQFVYAMR